MPDDFNDFLTGDEPSHDENQPQSITLTPEQFEQFQAQQQQLAEMNERFAAAEERNQAMARMLTGQTNTQPDLTEQYHANPAQFINQQVQQAIAQQFQAYQSQQQIHQLAQTIASDLPAVFHSQILNQADQIIRSVPAGTMSAEQAIQQATHFTRQSLTAAGWNNPTASTSQQPTQPLSQFKTLGMQMSMPGQTGMSQQGSGNKAFDLRNIDEATFVKNEARIKASLGLS
jgi:hypothetical protein